MDRRTQNYIKNFFTGVSLEGQPIQAVVINDEGGTPGTGVFLLSTGGPPYYQVGLTFPENWERPSLITKEEWQEYIEASRAVDIE